MAAWESITRHTSGVPSGCSATTPVFHAFGQQQLGAVVGDAEFVDDVCRQLRGGDTFSLGESPPVRMGDPEYLCDPAIGRACSTVSLDQDGGDLRGEISSGRVALVVPVASATSTPSWASRSTR